MTELSEVLKHANLAHFDNELTSFVIIMMAKGDPELHMAVSSDDAFAINAALDMFKIEMIKILNARAEERKPRE